MLNDGKEYESFVQKLQQALLNSEKFGGQENVKVERNVKLKDNAGITREFDLYWEYELGGITYKTVIECKDYTSKVTIDRIDSLQGKTAGFPYIKPLFATRIGYQSGARKKADMYGIDLLIVREQNEKDWVDNAGNPILKSINIDMAFSLSAKIIKFSPVIDAKWAIEQTNIDISKPISITGRNDEIIIDNIDMKDKYSLLQLEERLGHNADGLSGNLIKKEEFNNAFLHFGDKKLKILSYTVEYQKGTPQIIPMQIDYFKELIGVIEYLQKGKKVKIFKNKIVKD
jgi:hypothetical protein